MSASENVPPEYINHFLHFEKFATEIEKYELITPEEAQKDKTDTIENLKKQLAKARVEMAIAFSNKKMTEFNILANAEIPELEKELANAENDVYCASDIATGFKKMAQQALYLWQSGNMKNQEKVRVAIIGDFSSGKSSFINSLLGESFCPVDVAASTSSITTFKYGDVKRIFCVDGDIKTEISTEQYTKLVTHQGQSGEKYQFDVFYPFDGFRDLELFDTPGFNNSNNNEDEKVTLQKCQMADIIFFVFDINKGDVGDDIKKKLLSIKETKPSLLIHAIVNKSDQKPPVKIKEIEQQLRETGLFFDVVAYSSTKELNKYQQISFNTILDTLGYLDKKLTGTINSQWLIEKENSQIVVKVLKQQLSEQRQVINSWFENIHNNNINILHERLEKQKYEYIEWGKYLLSEILEYLQYYSEIENQTILPLVELSNEKIDEIFFFVKEKLKRYLEQGTSQIVVSQEEKSFFFDPYYKNVLSGFYENENENENENIVSTLVNGLLKKISGMNTKKSNAKTDINSFFLDELQNFHSKLPENMKVYFANYPTEFADIFNLELNEKVNNYKKEIDSIFKSYATTGYYENKEQAINHLRRIINNDEFQDYHAKEISNILILSFNNWTNEIRNYESANNGYISAKNEASLTLKQQIDEFNTSFVQHS